MFVKLDLSPHSLNTTLATNSLYAWEQAGIWECACFLARVRRAAAGYLGLTQTESHACMCPQKMCKKKKNLLKKDVIMINVYNDLMEDTEQTTCFYASLFLGLAKQDDTIW